ncbi:unnamed protein product [Rotaria socialis]|uniref:Phosphoglycerate mutase n=1 Tax=Rotaria socialis TaxID=392032 RepID=A0A821DJS6_9BILA|nr:unnamed protein product [Rotaria socialis]CAF4622901.1 unnamed protein product [Rotaria socialis]
MYPALDGYYQAPRSLHRQSLLYNNGYLASEDSDYYSSTSGRKDTRLRFIIIRHGERVDNNYGPGWTQHAFNYTGQYYPFDANMPPSLPFRLNWLDYETDAPLTLRGLQQSWNVGNAFAQQNIPIAACYSSPAIRCIQTADQILGGMNRKMHMPIRIELGLFECSSWYAGSPINFMSYQELINGGLNIDTQYHSYTKYLRPSENEYQYYERSKDTMKKLFKLHRKTGGTILIVAHAPSLEVLTRQLMNEQPRPEQLLNLASRVDYCSMTIVDREPSSKSWQFQNSIDQQVDWQQQQQQQLQQQQLQHWNQTLTRSTTRPYASTNLFANYPI